MRFATFPMSCMCACQNNSHDSSIFQPLHLHQSTNPSPSFNSSISINQPLHLHQSTPPSPSINPSISINQPLHLHQSTPPSPSINPSISINQPLQSCPVLYLHERFAFSVCRSVEQCVWSGVLAVRAMTGLHVFSQAITRMKALLVGGNLPQDHTHCARPPEHQGVSQPYILTGCTSSVHHLTSSPCVDCSMGEASSMTVCLLPMPTTSR